MYTDPADMAPHVFENRFPGFAATLKSGDALYCETLFGIGSSREQAVTSLLAAGVTTVLAPRFGRIFFRNAWNLGLLALEVQPFPAQDQESLTLNLYEGELTGSFGTATFNKPSEEMLAMWREGGLLQRTANRLKRGHAQEALP